MGKIYLIHTIKIRFLKTSQNSQENTRLGVSNFNKIGGLRGTLLKMRLRHTFFPVNFEKFLRTPPVPATLKGD